MAQKLQLAIIIMEYKINPTEKYPILPFLPNGIWCRIIVNKRIPAAKPPTAKNRVFRSGGVLKKPAIGFGSNF